MTRGAEGLPSDGGGVLVYWIQASVPVCSVMMGAAAAAEERAHERSRRWLNRDIGNKEIGVPVY
jgi:hypothetical protein